MTQNTYTLKIGTIDCTVLLDGTSFGDAGFIFSQVDAAELDHALCSRGLQLEKFPNSWNCLLVDTEGELVLLDTGWGQDNNPKAGDLVPLLGSAGISPEQIDMVLLSHAHMDHTAGCITADGAPVYPNARYLMAQAEYEYWLSDVERPDMLQRMAVHARKIFDALGPRLEFFQPDDEILPGIRPIQAYGHTPGHTAFEIHSAGERLLYLSDTILTSLHIEHPGWTAIVDADPAQTVATRRRIFARAASENLLVHFYHFDHPGLGYIKSHENGWIWKPL